MSGWRLSLNTATTKRWTLPEAVDGCLQAGIPGIAPWRDRVAEYGLARSAGLLRRSGLTVTSLCRGGFLTRDGWLHDNQRAVAETAELGCDTLVLVAGGLAAGSRDLDGARDRVSAGLEQLLPPAQAHGVRLALEPLHPMFCADRSVVSTLHQALDLVAPYPADSVGICLDAYHVWWDPDVWSGITRAGREGRLHCFQVCDWLLPIPAGALLGRGHVGDGCIDVPGFADAVAATGYAGFVEVEIFNDQVWQTPGAQTLQTLVERHQRFLSPTDGPPGRLVPSNSPARKDRA